MEADDPVLEMLQETLLGEVADRLEVGLLVWHEGGPYIAANRAACELLGCTRMQLLGLPAGIFGGEVELHGASAAFRVRSSSGGHAALDRKDGTEVEVEWISVPSRAGGLPAMVTVFWREGSLPAPLSGLLR